MNTTAAAEAGLGGRPAFTASQVEELHVQALIFKHMLMGVPVPHELLLSVRTNLASMATRLYSHPTMGYCSYLGKKFDPEPGRCRRTDGKKWRCSKDAYPDSRYCERHMNRGKNRSRKPVETPPRSQSQSPTASTVTSLAPSRGSGSFQGIPTQSIANAQDLFSSGASASHLQGDSGSYGIGSRDYRYPYTIKAEVGEHSFFSEASGSAKSLGGESTMESSWGMPPSQISSLPVSRMMNGFAPESNHYQLPAPNNLGQITSSSVSKQDQTHNSFFGSEFASVEPLKRSQSLRPFFDEWPKARGSWPDLEEERSSQTSFSTTQLSISMPMASSNFSITSSRSP